MTVSTNRECQWSAAPAAGWIQLGGSANGQGEGSVSFTVASNADPAERKGAIAVGDQQIGITQQAAPCVFTVNPQSDSVGAAGGRRTLAVTASSPQCTWTARSDVEWIAIVDGAQGTGSGQVTYEARGTTGPTRNGTLLVAGHAVTVTQGAGCNTSITPASQNVAASGGPGTITVATEAGCPWSAQSNVPWVQITSGQTGTGPGTVGFSVTASTGPARSGTLTVDGRVFTVSQASGCTYTIAPASQSIAAAGGPGTVNVHAGAGCEWSARSNAAWLAIASGTTGSGEGRVQFTVAASTGPARSATLTVAGRTFTVAQESGCSYALTPSSQDFGDAGGQGSFTVTTTAECPWTVTVNAMFVTLTSPPTGAGTSTVAFGVIPNPMGLPARSGTIGVNGQTFTVNQAAGVPCVYTVTPPSMEVGAAAGSATFLVTTVGTCPWTARPNDAWISIPNWASGAGSATVTFHFSANPPGSPARTGTISVGSQTFTLTQAAAPGATAGAALLY